jgi:hypothetical protein
MLGKKELLFGFGVETQIKTNGRAMQSGRSWNVIIRYNIRTGHFLFSGRNYRISNDTNHILITVILRPTGGLHCTTSILFSSPSINLDRFSLRPFA